uniref:Uncharacterized protein n=1 Tax=Ovis aries TaxID=9940 RepID=A0AC11DA39_SHEEP
MAGDQDMFDAVVMADERFHGEGYREGYEEGSSLGMIEGRRHGTLHGAKVGSEIGCYQGFAFAWRGLLHSCATERDRLFTFVLFPAGNVPVTCLCWETPRRATINTHRPPQAPARSPALGQTACVPRPAPAFGLSAHTFPHRRPRTDRPARTPFGSDRGATARRVEVSTSEGLAAGRARRGCTCQGPGGRGCPVWGCGGRCKSFWFGSVLGGSWAYSPVSWLIVEI